MAFVKTLSQVPSRRQQLSLSPLAGSAVFGLAVLCLVAALALVDFSPQQLDTPTPSTGMRVLESVGMSQVLSEKGQVDEREKHYLSLAGQAHNAQLALDKATAHKIKLTNSLDNLDKLIDRQTAQISKDAALAEEKGDTANDLINKVHDHEHHAASDKRHAQTAERREKREKVSLGEFTSQASELSSKAAAELKDAMRRQVKASKLRQLARKHKEDAAVLKQHIRDVLRGKVASLSAAIDHSQRAALQATQDAKDAEKSYASLSSRASKHEQSARLAQQNADQAALAAERADKEAARLASKVSAELSVAQKSKHELARLLNSAANPEGATTLRTAIPTAPAAKTLKSPDVTLGRKPHASKEMQEAARKIRELERAKRAEQAREYKERQAEEELRKELDAEKKQKALNRIVNESPVSKHPAAASEDEDNFSAAMNYLNNHHLDAADGLDDHGRDAVGREVEGRRAFVGVFGRSPHLDSIATANLKQYQQDESEQERANYDNVDGSAMEGNPF